MDFMLLLKAAVMGIVEGLTEFLPISSTGHLILAGALLGFDDAKAKVFDIAIQTGAIFAVVLVFWDKIRSTVMALPSQRMARRFAVNVLIAFLPAVLLGLLFGKAIKAHLFTPTVVATTFILAAFGGRNTCVRQTFDSCAQWAGGAGRALIGRHAQPDAGRAISATRTCRGHGRRASAGRPSGQGIALV